MVFTMGWGYVVCGLVCLTSSGFSSGLLFLVGIFGLRFPLCVRVCMVCVVCVWCVCGVCGVSGLCCVWCVCGVCGVVCVCVCICGVCVRGLAH